MTTTTTTMAYAVLLRYSVLSIILWLHSSSAAALSISCRGSYYHRYRIPPTLVNALDLTPLMNHVATYACTNRGKQAILDLVALPSTLSPFTSLLQSNGNHRRRISLFENNNTHRKRRIDWYAAERIGWRKDVHARSSTSQHPIITVAQSAEEATIEYELVHNAMVILRSQQCSNDPIPLPPMFHLYDGASSQNSIVDGGGGGDDDEWLDLCTGPLPQGIDIYQEIDLQTILQAEQVIKLLLMTYRWATSNESVPPCLADVVRLMESKENDLDLDDGQSNDSMNKSIHVLEELYEILKGTVEIVRAGPSLLDPTNRFSYQFQLATGKDRFPELDKLRNKEKQLINNDKDNVVEQLTKIRAEITILEDLIKRKLISSMIRGANHVQNCMNILARLDVIFAKASFGCDWDGIIPDVRIEGRIYVEEFIHPVLAVEKGMLPDRLNANAITPVDLILPEKKSYQALIISGPNGGGKTLALKSFGLVAIMAKLALPIISLKRDEESNIPTVDYFDNILVEMGDSQSITKQESTLMARLNSLSSLIQNMALSSSSHAQLILLDELGGGTDPVAGSAISQSILEKLLSSNPECKVVATTHSPQLKVLSKMDNRFESASVLLGEDKNPTFQLRYGITGESYALEAARRARPSLPEDVLIRAADLINGGNANATNSLMQYLAVLEEEQFNLMKFKNETETTWNEIRQYKDDMISKLQISKMQLSRLESRLSNIFETLQQDKTKETYELVGNSLEELRLLRRKVQTEEDLLREKGLRRVPDSYKLYESQRVVITMDGEWKGYDAIIHAVDDDDPLTLSVVPVLDFFTISDELEQEPILLRRADIAIFDNPDWYFSDSTATSTMTKRGRARSESNPVLTALSTLSSKKKIKVPSVERAKEESSTFTSARQRKAAAAAAASRSTSTKHKKGNKKK